MFFEKPETFRITGHGLKVVLDYRWVRKKRKMFLYFVYSVAGKCRVLEMWSVVFVCSG